MKSYFDFSLNGFFVKLLVPPFILSVILKIHTKKENLVRIFNLIIQFLVVLSFIGNFYLFSKLPANDLVSGPFGERIYAMSPIILLSVGLLYQDAKRN